MLKGKAGLSAGRGKKGWGLRLLPWRAFCTVVLRVAEGDLMARSVASQVYEEAAWL